MLHYEIIVDHGETPNKCTITPLAYRADFKLHFQPPRGLALSADLLLHPEGVELNASFRSHFPVKLLGAIDCVWRRLPPLLESLSGPLPQLVSIPQDFLTAYPRISKKDYDPSGGLATIEALFIAGALLGQPDLSLLREYFFADRFLAMNEASFRRHGIVFELGGPVFRPSLERNSRNRRLARGRPVL